MLVAEGGKGVFSQGLCLSSGAGLAFDAGAQQCVAQLEQSKSQRLQMRRERDLP